MNETVLVSGQDAVYRHLGGEAPTLVLVHGAGGNHASFDELTVQLGGRETVVPSLPGRCGSAGPPLERVSDMAAWLRKLLRTIGLRRVVVAGHSLGGAVALQYALAEGSEGNGMPALAGLVLISTGARLRVKQPILDAAAEAAEHNMPTEIAPEAWEKDVDPGFVERVERARARTGAAVTLADWRAADGFDLLGALDGIACPTLIVQGTEDHLTPEKYGDYLLQHIPGAKREVLYGASHMCVAERPAAVARAIGDFLRSLPA